MDSSFPYFSTNPKCWFFYYQSFHVSPFLHLSESKWENTLPLALAQGSGGPVSFLSHPGGQLNFLAGHSGSSCPCPSLNLQSCPILLVLFLNYARRQAVLLAWGSFVCYQIGVSSSNCPVWSLPCPHLRYTGWPFFCRNRFLKWLWLSGLVN